MASFLRHRVIASDTLRGLALRYFGDHDLWVAIVEMNSLAPDQFDLVGIKELLIPIVIGSGDAQTESPYLADLYVKNGGLTFAPQRDAGLVSGVQNVMGAIVRQLSTDKGAMVHHPGYGLDLDRFVGTAGTRLFLRLLKVEVERVIRRDPRVADVRGVRIVQPGTLRQIQIGARIMLVGGRDMFDLAVERSF